MQITNKLLAIGVPLNFPYVPQQFFDSFVLMQKPDFIFLRANNGGIDAMRNNLVEKALDVGATSLIMMDTDMVYHPETIPRLLSHRLPIVGAMCWRRYPPFDPIMLRVGETGEFYEAVEGWEPGELVEVDATGAGCILYDMNVFRKMPRPWFKFVKDPATGAVRGEDIGFCQDLRKAGYQIFVDTSIPAKHLATMVVDESVFKLHRYLSERKEFILAEGIGVKEKAA